MYVVLVYDISQEKNGAKRWSKVFKISKKYLSHIQNSVFEGELTPAQLRELKMKARDIMDPDEDSLIIFTSRNDEWLEKEVIGKEKNKLTSFL